jgi:hypothetical protein
MHTAIVHAVTVAAATAASAADTAIDIAAAAAANGTDAITTRLAVDAIPATQRHRCDVLLPHLREWVRAVMIPSYRVGDERV